MSKSLTEKEISEKYSNIEDKIPSVWEDFEKAGIELAQDLIDVWDISDAELIRVIALVGIRVRRNDRRIDLSNHVNPMLMYHGLYPEIMKTFKIKPEVHTTWINAKESLPEIKCTDGKFCHSADVKVWIDTEIRNVNNEQIEKAYLTPEGWCYESGEFMTRNDINGITFWTYE
jgi:hypothetical protein